MSADDPPSDGGHLGRWYGVATTFVAPATFLSALLFYFGYVSSRAQYRAFGIDVDTLGLATRDYVMRSPQGLLVPLLVVALGGVLALLFHLAVRDRDLPPRVVATAFWAGVVVLVAGLVLLFGHGVFGDLGIYGVLTPGLIASGVAVALYAARWPGAPRFLTAEAATGSSRPGVVFLSLVIVITCVFWASATIAEWSGRGAAVRLAERLDQLPVVILDTTERLYLTDGVVEERQLPREEDQVFRYRYRGLRLLVQGSDHLFLVPDRWTPSNSTLVVPMDGSIRVRFQFVDLRIPAPPAL